MPRVGGRTTTVTTKTTNTPRATMPRRTSTRSAKPNKQPAKRQGGRGFRQGSSVPIAISRPLMNPGEQTQRFQGSEIVDILGLSPGAANGDLVAEFLINPRLLVDTRLSRQAALWDLWKVNQFCVEVIPSVPTTVAGSYVMGVDPDPKADYAGMSSLNRVKALSNVPGGGIYQLFQPAKAKLSARRNTEWLFCNPDNDEPYKTMAGVVACALVAPPAGITGQLSLTFKISYDILFKGQSLEEPTIGGVKSYTLNGVSPTSSELLYRVAWTGTIPDVIFLITDTGLGLSTQAADLIMEEYPFGRTVQLEAPYMKFYKNVVDARSGSGALALQKSQLEPANIPLEPGYTPTLEVEPLNLK